MICKGCGENTVDRNEEARYDVLNPEADLDHPENLGPYDAACFAETYTGKKLAEGNA